MLAALRNTVDRASAPLPGYLLIFSGMALLAMALMVPAWMESRELAWQVSLMELQAKRLADQENSYREFNTALAEDDPVLLERLAFYHLRLKPAGSTPLDPGAGPGLAGYPRAVNAGG